jgi:hypothetical protein
LQSKNVISYRLVFASEGQEQCRIFGVGGGECRYLAAGNPIARQNSLTRAFSRAINSCSGVEMAADRH